MDARPQCGKLGRVVAASKCTEGKKRPDLKGKKPRYECRRCGMLARKKGDLCKPRKLKA